jgi:actin, putative (fragment)
MVEVSFFKIIHFCSVFINLLVCCSLITHIDEVGALVFDFGHYSVRAGFAGEDSLKAEIPTMVGFLNEVADDSTPMEIDSKPVPQTQPQRKYFIDTTSLHVPRKGMEMITFLKDGMSLVFLTF